MYGKIMEKQYIQLDQLEVYQISRELSRIAWEKIYEPLSWQSKKILGDQFITAVDSVGANIAEGYGRYHFLDKAKFYYHARASLFESLHWLKLFIERNIIDQESAEAFVRLYEQGMPKLNALIKSVKESKIKNS